MLDEIQAKTVDDAKKFYKGDCLRDVKDVFTIAGLAGTGKSHVIPHIISEINISKDRILYCAFTGAVCNMLIARGIPARTIHSAFFNCSKVLNKETNRYEFKLMIKEIEEITDHYDLIVLDELSTVNDFLLQTVRKFGLPIIAMGDPGQFKAIGGSDISQSLFEKKDVFFERVYRNGGYMLECANRARLGDFTWLKKGVDQDNLAIINKYDTQSVDYFSTRVSQIITHSNKERVVYNDRVRLLKGYEGIYPNIGEKVICTENNWDIASSTGILSLTNGLQGIVTDIWQNDLEYEHGIFDMNIHNVILKNEEFNNLKCDGNIFLGHDWNPIEEAQRRLLFNIEIFNQFDFGYAITAYKAQGSEWNSVLAMGARMPFDEVKRYYYVVMTRAKKFCFLAI